MHIFYVCYVHTSQCFLCVRATVMPECHPGIKSISDSDSDILGGKVLRVFTDEKKHKNL